jgi:hypothetical protein
VVGGVEVEVGEDQEWDGEDVMIDPDEDFTRVKINHHVEDKYTRGIILFIMDKNRTP